MKKNKIYLLIALLSLSFSACEYDFEAPIPTPENVSFNADIKPIFEGKCAGCHKVGGIKPFPDLTADNAFNSINSDEYINLTTPENSLIYTKPSPGASHGATYSTEEAAFVLAWIKQGAEDN